MTSAAGGAVMPKPLEADDRDRLLEALPRETLPEKRDQALMLLLLSTGARISEILRLNRSDWKPDRMWSSARATGSASSR
jgi:integrase